MTPRVMTGTETTSMNDTVMKRKNTMQSYTLAFVE